MGGPMTELNQVTALRPEYEPETGTYRVAFDETDYRPSTVVVLAVAAVTGTDARDVETLNDRIDPDCLDGIFAPTQNGKPRADGRVTFPFAGHEVTVHGDGVVVLDPDPGS